MHPRRLVRLNELIHQTVSQLALTLKDPGLGFITITGAQLSPDVSSAKIFYSVYGSDREKEATAQALERAKPRFRHEVGKLENLRKVPNLIFIYDQSVERADRIARVLNTIHAEKAADETNTTSSDNENS